MSFTEILPGKVSQQPVLANPAQLQVEKISRGPFQHQQFCDSLEVTLSFTTEFGLGKEFLLIKQTKTFISSALLNSLGSHSCCPSPIFTSEQTPWTFLAKLVVNVCFLLRTEMLLMEFQKGQLHKTSLPVMYSK